jgi:hypothetical protein
MNAHRHKWEVSKESGKLVCNVDKCNTMTDLDTLLANTRVETANQTKVDVLVKQLRAGELKKFAYEPAYAWVTAHAPNVAVRPEQATFL